MVGELCLLGRGVRVGVKIDRGINLKIDIGIDVDVDMDVDVVSWFERFNNLKWWVGDASGGLRVHLCLLKGVKGVGGCGEEEETESCLWC